MKCPELYKIMQATYRKPIISEDDTINGELSILTESKYFGECYKNECMAWDKEKERCKLLGREEK